MAESPYPSADAVVPETPTPPAGSWWESCLFVSDLQVEDGKDSFYGGNYSSWRLPEMSDIGFLMDEAVLDRGEALRDNEYDY